MPRWAKVILIILLVIVLLIGAAIFAGWWWIRNHAAELEKGGKEAVAEAKQFGTGKPAEACVTEALNRADACDGFICEAKVKIFLTNCLEAAEVSPEFCSGVPDGVVAGATWSVEECQRRGKGQNQRCLRTISGIAEFCRKRNKE